MKKYVKIFGAIITITVAMALFTACEPEFKSVSQQLNETPQLPATSFEYTSVDLATGTKKLKDLFPAGAEVTNSTATLGRVLFYDKRMSINNVIACASCHKQEIAFSDNVSFSNGFGGKLTTRNSMAIINPLGQGSLFWDSRANDAKELSLMPVFNHIEMGMESDEALIVKLSNTSFYPQLFETAFGDAHITRSRISTAIAHFLSSIQHGKSKFDIGKTNQFANFTELEKLGKDIFFSPRAKCSLCHGDENFLPPASSIYYGPEIKATANIGLDVDYKDNGFNQGQFKTPSLRNVALTAPYMHDGRFASLNDVLNHYSHNIKNHPNLDANLKTGAGPIRLNFSEEEKVAIIAFLKTLTDEYFITDKKYSNPFKK